jgi:predicted metal-binding membrane protein
VRPSSGGADAIVGPVEPSGWPASERTDLARAAIVAALLVVAALSWLLTDERMAGMDEGPATDPGSLGFYVSVWIVMMAAMMLPSAGPMVVAHAEVQRRKRDLGGAVERGGTAAFVGGYMVVWTAFGIVAYALFELLRSLDVDALAWSRNGRYAASAVIAIAAIYQLTPLKDVCLAKCRSPLGFVVGSWRDGRLGAARMGIEHGGWCVGCCWALMVTLFALGFMSVAWMAVIAALVALEKLLPRERVAKGGVALLLVVLALCVALAPERLPGLTVPGHSEMPSMQGAGTSMDN